MKPVRVLHMHFGTDGGAERFFINLAQAFGERGVEQRFVIRPGRDWHSQLEPLGPVLQSHFRLISPRSLLLRWQVAQTIRTWKPDAVMAWMSRASKLLPAQPGPVRLTRLGDYPRHLRNFRNNDLIVANTPGIAEACRALGWTKPLHVVSNFVREVQPVAVSRAALDTPQDAFLVVGTGRFVNRKGFDTLVRAAARVPGAWLWLAGDGDRRAELEALVKELGLAPRTRFLGWVEEPLHYVAAGDVYVMPSRHEPLGNVILEAWKARVPVVSTRSEGPSWFATHEQDSLLVGIDEVDEMAAAIARVRADRALAQALVAGGTAALEARFTKDRVVDQYLDIFAGRY